MKWIAALVVTVCCSTAFAQTERDVALQKLNQVEARYRMYNWSWSPPEKRLDTVGQNIGHAWALFSVGELSRNANHPYYRRVWSRPIDGTFRSPIHWAPLHRADVELKLKGY